MSIGETLETERLHLRRWTDDDIEDFHAIWGDPEVIWWGANESIEHTREMLPKLVAQHATYPEGVGWYSVVSKATGRVVGDVLLQPAKFIEGIEIGWHFRRDAWGQGYATEAARRVADFALQEAGVETLYAIVATENDRSLRIVEKLGMQRIKQMTYADLPHVLFSLESGASPRG